MNDKSFATMRELGRLYGKSSHQVGRLLLDLGYRRKEQGNTYPSERAFSEGLVAKQWDQERTGIFNWVWHVEKTSALLEMEGWRRLDNGTSE